MFDSEDLKGLIEDLQAQRKQLAETAKFDGFNDGVEYATVDPEYVKIKWLEEDAELQRREHLTTSIRDRLYAHPKMREWVTDQEQASDAFCYTDWEAYWPAVQQGVLSVWERIKMAVEGRTTCPDEDTRHGDRRSAVTGPRKDSMQ
jgi:hypothetical protein